MIQKVLFPRWDSLSSKQKELAKKCIDAIIKLRAATKELSESFFPDDEEHRSKPIDNLLENFLFEVVDSSTTSEGIRIEEIIPPALLTSEEPVSKGVCQFKCLFDPDFSNCVRRCNRR
jgi:hypothetical protein